MKKVVLSVFGIAVMSQNVFAICDSVPKSIYSSGYTLGKEHAREVIGKPMANAMAEGMGRNDCNMIIMQYNNKSSKHLYEPNQLLEICLEGVSDGIYRNEQRHDLYKEECRYSAYSCVSIENSYGR